MTVTPKRVPLFPWHMTDVVADRFAPPRDPYINDPIGWIRAKLYESPTRDQCRMAQSVADNRLTAAACCHEIGKSYIASRLAAWWIDVHPPGEAFVVTTAPTAKQVHAVLWRELGRVHDKGNLAGRVNLSDEWYIPVGGHQELVAFGRKPADYDPSAFQGIHARYVLVIVDEAGGVEGIWDAIHSIAANKHARIFAPGNPDDPTAHFATICAPGSGWNVITVDALETPGFTEETIAPYPELVAIYEAEGINPSTERVSSSILELLVDVQFAVDGLRMWGADNPVFQSKVRGRFPDVSEDALITPAMIRQAISIDHPGIDLGRAAFDIASTGSAETCGYWNREGHVRLIHSARGHDTMRTTGVISAFARKHSKRVPIWIDAIGLGRGVYDRARELNLPVYAFVAGEKAYQPKLYANRRAETWWQTREGFEAGWWDIDERDIDLHAQLQAPKWKTRSNGQIIIESKEDMQKRGVASPDRGDAFVMSTAVPPAAPIMIGQDEPQLNLTGDMMDREF